MMRSAIFFRATGLIGNELLKLLIQNNNYSKLKYLLEKN